jgi:hypothetical protein
MGRSSTRRTSRTSTWPTEPLRSQLDSPDLLLQAAAVLLRVELATTIAAVAVAGVLDQVVAAVGRDRGARALSDYAPLKQTQQQGRPLSGRPFALSACLEGSELQHFRFSPQRDIMGIENALRNL